MKHKKPERTKVNNQTLENLGWSDNISETWDFPDEGCKMSDDPMRFTGLTVKCLRARGEVTIEECPSFNNHFTAVILVDDGPIRGNDQYQIEIMMQELCRIEESPE